MACITGRYAVRRLGICRVVAMRYIQKPVEVEAFQLTRDVDIQSPRWLIDAVNKEKIYIDRAIIAEAAKYMGAA